MVKPSTVTIALIKGVAIAYCCRAGKIPYNQICFLTSFEPDKVYLGPDRNYKGVAIKHFPGPEYPDFTWGACWTVSVTERVKTLFFSPFPPGPHLRGSRFSRPPPLTRSPGDFSERRKTGSAAPSPWKPGPQACPPRLISFRQPPQARRRTACVLFLTRSGKPGFLHRLISCAQSRLRISCQS